MAISLAVNSMVLSGYLILCFYHVIKDFILIKYFISNSSCSAKDTSNLWKEPHRDLESNLKGNDKFSKKWTVISHILCFSKIK